MAGIPPQLPWPLRADQVVLNDGINSAFRPDQIGQAQAAWAENMTIRTGKPETRDYKIIQRGLLPGGRVQGVGYFSRDLGSFILCVGGSLWRILLNGTNLTVDGIPLATRNSALIPQVYMVETNGSFLIQDGQSAGIIWDGSQTRRANIFNNELPIGTAMAYGNGRLAVVVDGSTVQVGNITSDVYQSELQFTETTYLSGGGAFFFPHAVTGLGFLPVNNTNTGFGSLVVFGSRFANTLGLQITARELWDQIPGFQQVVLPRIGCAGQNTIIGVNQDLYWRDDLGNIWSMRSAQWDALSPGNSPLSREVSRVVDFETKDKIQYSSGVFFNNRIMYLASPFNNLLGGTSFKYILSLDAAPLATMRGKSPPAYDGVASGLNFTNIFSGQINGVDRAFVISLDYDNSNRLWEIVPNEVADASFMSLGVGSGNVLVYNPVTTYEETRRYDFGQPGLKKQLMRVDLWPTEINGSVTVTVYWRADNRTQWQTWGAVTFCATTTNEDNQWFNLSNQERGRVKTLTAPDIIDVIDNQRADVGYGFQVRVEWQGALLMDRITLYARPLPETAYSEQSDTPSTCVENIVTNNTISYSIPIGGLGSAYVDQDELVYDDQFGTPYTQQIS